MTKLQIPDSRHLESRCARTTGSRVKVYCLLSQEMGDADGTESFYDGRVSAGPPTSFRLVVHPELAFLSGAENTRRRRRHLQSVSE